VRVRRAPISETGSLPSTNDIDVFIGDAGLSDVLHRARVRFVELIGVIASIDEAARAESFPSRSNGDRIVVTDCVVPHAPRRVARQFENVGQLILIEKVEAAEQNGHGAADVRDDYFDVGIAERDAARDQVER
jgi:hypothetical protein